jgi:hypothetical protein
MPSLDNDMFNGQFPADEQPLEEACWSGYKQVGMKEVKGRMVPNCVPMEEAIDPKKALAKALQMLGNAAKQEPTPDFRSMSPEERRNYKGYEAERRHPGIPLDMIAQYGKGAAKQQARYALSEPMVEKYTLEELMGMLEEAGYDMNEINWKKLATSAALAAGLAGSAGAQGTHPQLGSTDAQRADSTAMVSQARDYMNAPASSDAELDALNKFGASAKQRAGRVFTTQARNIPQYQGPENATRRAADSTAVTNASMMARMQDLMQKKADADKAGQAELDRERVGMPDADANRAFTGAQKSALDTLAKSLRPRTTESHDETDHYCTACLMEVLKGQHPEQLGEAEYQGRSVPLGKPMRGDVKKFKVFVKDPSTGNVKKVNFGDPNMRIKKSNPARRRSFRARHNCDNPGPRTKARYWSCRKW